MHHDWGKPFAIGGIPVYTHLQSSGFDMVGFPFMGMAPPAEWQLRTDFGRFPYCDLYNARYIVAPRTLPAPTFGDPIASRGDLVVYEVATSGYFGLGAVEALDLSRVPTGSLRSAPWAEVYRLGKAWLDGPGPAEHRYLAMQDTAPEPLPDGPVEGEIRGESVGPGRFACEVAVPRPADLVLKVTFHPYWQCRVNGVPTPVARVFPGFMAVRLPSGNSAVEFVYRPPSYQKWLFALSGLMLAGGIAAAFPWRRGSGRITA